MATSLPSTARGRKRLLKVADLLDNDAKNKKSVRFDLDVIVAHSRLYLQDGTDKWLTIDKPELNCGTTACAIGLVCISGLFKDFSFIINHYNSIQPVYKEYQGFYNATQVFFDINENEVEYLFTPSTYNKSEKKGARGERAVAKRIRQFVAGKLEKQMQKWYGPDR